MATQVENILKRTTPEAQGIQSATILKFVETLESQIQEIHSFMLVRHGHVVAEGWWSPYAPQHQHMLFSLSKSFASTAVGMAISEGYFSLDDAVISFFPDETPDDVNDNLKAMQVRHLLSMSTGHNEDTSPHMFPRPDGQWTKGFFEVPVLHEPGTHFLYNTGATYMLSAIVQKTTGKTLTEYLTPRLFEPLGIENPIWEISPQGIETGGFGLNIKTEDIARFGQLYLQKGIWNGERLLSEAWINEATSSQVSNGTDPQSDWAQGYGYQFWRCQHNAYRGDGAFGQYCIVMPEQDAVLAITSGLGDMQKPLNIVWDILLPAMEDNALPEDAVSHQKLTDKLASLAFVPVKWRQTTSKAAAVSGLSYQLEDNPFNIKSMTFNFSDAENTVSIAATRGEETITCGFGQWQQGKSILFSDPRREEIVPIAVSGAWTSINSFTMIVRLYTTPFYNTFKFTFDNDSIDIESQMNVNFDPNLTSPSHIKGQVT